MREKLKTVMACLLFALPFGGVGAGAAYVIGKAIYDGHRASDWVRVKADLQGFGNGNIDYSYVFNGQRYHGDRLGTNPIGGTDNVDSWHEDVDAHLSEARSQSKPIMVWVNPDNPSESMFDRQIRWKLMLFASVFAFGFGGVGVGALAFAAVSLLPRRVRRKAGKAESTGLGIIWAFAFFWNVIAFPTALLAIPQMWEEGNFVGFLVLIFPLIGLFLAWCALKMTWDYLRRGRAKLVLDRDEIAAGDPVAGHVAFGRKVKAGESFRVRLEALKEPGQPGERTAWSKEVTARVTDSGSGPRLAFRFDPPRLRATTTDPEDTPAFGWRLDVIAANRAADLHYKFPIVVAEPEVDAAPVPAR